MHRFLQGIPKKMKELEFAHVMMVGTAANMAVYVLRDTEEEDQVVQCASEKEFIFSSFFRKKWKSLILWTNLIWSTQRR